MSLNKLKEAFADFYSIESNDLFPKKLIMDEIYPSLTVLQKELIRAQEFYQNASEYRRIRENYAPLLVSICSIDILESEYESLADLS